MILSWVGELEGEVIVKVKLPLGTKSSIAPFISLEIFPMSDEQRSTNPAKATQILQKNALEERFKDHTPQPGDADYNDYLTYQALKMVEAQRLKRIDNGQ
jgi:hypothetical protein